MGEDKWIGPKRVKFLLKEIKDQKEELKDKQKKSILKNQITIIIISSLLIVSSYLSAIEHSLSTVTVVIEIGTLLLVGILFVQFNSLKREIKGIISSLEEQKFPVNFAPKYERRRLPESDVMILSKVYDVNKNVIDKLFEKLKTFSNSWLAVSGAIASGIIIEVLKTSELNLYLGMVILTCSVLLWNIAQDFYGRLNYELVKKTKDLAYWWILNTYPIVEYW